ncbi:MAG: hypothetical protein FWD17_14645 [Polyangiaceae bacterium]|nr:hypothetical protein [Polyangiaceae bacterium]
MLSLVGIARLVRADETETSLDGPWTLSPLTESFVVQQWGGNCGPAPVSRTVFAAGPATITRDGPELVVNATSAHRTLRSDQCIDPLPTLTRDSHSAGGQTWRSRCETAPKDPRHAVIQTGYFLTPDGVVSIGETGRYEFAIKGSRCVADVTREATLRRTPVPLHVDNAVRAVSSVAQATPSASFAVAAPTAAAPEPDNMPCTRLGQPARLEIRPSRKLLRIGESYRFRAIVVDPAGCPTGTPIQWSLGVSASAKREAARASGAGGAPASASIDGTGRLTVPATATDMKFDVVASAGGRSARAAVEVTSPATYEALLAQSGLDSNGERRDPSVTSLTTSSLGATGAQAEDGARRRRLIFLAIVGGLSLVLGVIAAIAALRARKARAVERAAHARHEERMRAYEREKREREERHAAQTQAHLESVARARAAATATAGGSGTLFCPSCHKEFAPGTVFCPFDSNPLVPVADQGAIVGGPVGGVCPTCRRGYNPGVFVCPDDGDELVPPALMGLGPTPARGKICPTCGGRFDGNAAFCGKDGTQLVLIN